MIRNALKFEEKPKTRGRKHSLSQLQVNRLVREAKKEPSKTATELKKDVNIDATVQTVRNYLLKNSSKACSPRKDPFLSAKHVAKRIAFAKEHLNWPLEEWRSICWIDESKIVLYGGRGSRAYVRRPPSAEYKPKYTIKTIKHGGSSIIIWACISYYGVGPIYHIKTIMDQHVYADILEKVMTP